MGDDEIMMFHSPTLKVEYLRGKTVLFYGL
jgi:hypothetical protein